MREAAEAFIAGYMEGSAEWFENYLAVAEVIGQLHQETTDLLQADHIYPESKGGPTTLENLQTLCKPCSIRKGATVTT